MEEQKKKKKRKDLTNEDRIERYIASFYKDVKTEWDRLPNKDGLTFAEYFEMYRQKKIQEHKNQLVALDKMRPPAVIKMKKKILDK